MKVNAPRVEVLYTARNHNLPASELYVDGVILKGEPHIKWAYTSMINIHCHATTIC